MWFSQIVRSFFFTLDSTLFNLIPTVYDLLITISRTSILTQGQIKMFSDRIQALLGVFMLFKVTFSLITYIINPDDFSEKSKGFGKLWQNVIVTLIILILSPYAFSMAYDLQAMILDDNTLAGLVFGDNQEDYNYINTAGEKMAYTVMEPFFSPNTSLRNTSLRAHDEEEYDVLTLDECTTLYEIDENGKKTFNSDCRDAMEKMMDDNSTSSTSYLNNYIAGVENENLGLLFRLEMAKKTVVVNGDEEFLIDYMVPVSTVVVVIVLLILITFCLDVALRSVKLAFLQLISPIPIISYIDPKSGKDGMFKKWYQMCFSTYLSLFVRLLALYLAIYIIGLINSMTDVVTGAEVSNPWIKIFIIIGVLMFAKQLPKILEGFGIKLDGDGKFTLNPFKKIEDQALGGKQVLGGAKGLAAGAAIGAIGMASGAGLGRGISGAVGGLRAGISGKKAGEIRKDQVAKNAEMRNALANGSTFWGRRGAQLSSFVGASGALGGIESERLDIERDKKAIQEDIDRVNNLKQQVENNIAPKQERISNLQKVNEQIKAMQDRAVSKIKQGDGRVGAAYQKMLRAAAGLEATGNASDAAKAEMIKQRAEAYVNSAGRDRWIEDNLLAAGGDNKLKEIYSTYQAYAKIAGENIENTAKNIDAQSKSISGTITGVKNNIIDQEQMLVQYDNEIKSYNVKMQDVTTREKNLSEREKPAKADLDAVHGTAGGPGRRPH